MGISMACQVLLIACRRLQPFVYQHERSLQATSPYPHAATFRTSSPTTCIQIYLRPQYSNMNTNDIMDFSDQPSFRDLTFLETVTETSSAEVDFSSLRDISKRFRDELKLQHASERNDKPSPLSEECRSWKYGCPSRNKQLEALEHAMKLVSDRNRPAILSATGDELLL